MDYSSVMPIWLRLAAKEDFLHRKNPALPAVVSRRLNGADDAVKLARKPLR
jgi:hypothetical protein